jgi:hypothetical protein
MLSKETFGAVCRPASTRHSDRFQTSLGTSVALEKHAERGSRASTCTYRTKFKPRLTIFDVDVEANDLSWPLRAAIGAGKGWCQDMYAIPQPNGGFKRALDNRSDRSKRVIPILYMYT